MNKIQLNQPQKISVTILTKNSEKFIREVLDSVRNFAEVVIYDTGSTDKTLEISGEYSNVTIFHKQFVGFGPTHNAATKCATYDWILSVDSDEIVSPEMTQEIFSSDLNDRFVYSFPRHNYYNDTFIKWCGWYPDRQIRLYNRIKTRFTEAQVHEAIIADGMIHIQMNSPIIHYSYTSVSDFLTKMQSYSDLFAAQNKGKKSSSPCKAILHGFFAFFKSYILKKGVFGGYEGFSISVYNANTAFYKYLKLYEINKKS
jgi:glycosyltransferase involved in cell wall biosynthesis